MYNGFFDGKTVAVTGGAGFIGSHLTQHLCSLGSNVRVLDNFSSGHASNLEGIDAECVEGSILDRSALHRAIDGCDVVFHLAAMVSVPNSIEEPDFCFNTNISGTEHVISIAEEQGCARVIFASSAACYGSTPNLPSSEQDAVSIESPYAESKYEGERLIASMKMCDGVSLRFFNVFGQRQDPQSQYAAVVSAFQDALADHRSPIIYGDGSQTRDFTAVENIVHANLLAASHQEPLQGAVFNVGTGKAMSLSMLLHEMVGEEEVRITYKDAREGDVQHSLADITAISTTLGYSPILTTQKALRKLLSPRQL